MSFALFLPLLFSLAVFLLPVWLLRSGRGAGARDYFVSPRYTPPQAVRNSCIAYSLRLALFGPVFVFGAIGNFWPVIIGATCFGLGLYLVYASRRPIFTFLESALNTGQSITVHAFIARQHGDDPRVRLFAASLTLFVLIAAVACEVFALLGFFKLVLGSDTLARALAFGTLLLAVVYAVPAGHLGVIYSGQLQLGAIFFGLFAAAALLLYLHVSALLPLPAYGAFAIGFAAVFCVAILIYRRSRYIETGPVDPVSLSAKLLSKFGKVLNPVISIFVVLVIVLAGMEFSATSSPIPPDAGATLSSGSGMPLTSLAALVLLPLFYPLADIVHWQRLAAMEKNRQAYPGDTAGWQKALREFFRTLCCRDSVAVAFYREPWRHNRCGPIPHQRHGGYASAHPGGGFRREPDRRRGLFAVAHGHGHNGIILNGRVLLGRPLHHSLRHAVRKRGNIFPQRRRPPFLFGYRHCTHTGHRNAADEFHQQQFSRRRLCPRQPRAVVCAADPRADYPAPQASPSLGLCILGLGAGSTAGGLAGYLATGNETWLWAAVPACLGLGFLLLAVSRLWDRQGSRIR